MSCRSILVVAPGSEAEEAAAEEHRRRAEAQALGMFEQVADLERYFYNVHRDTASGESCTMSLSSDMGQERLHEALDRAQQRRRRHFEAIQETVEGDGIKTAVTSHETAYHFRGLGSWTSDTCLVYDGTTYSYGRPLYDQGDLETIVTNADAPLYTVKVIGNY